MPRPVQHGAKDKPGQSIGKQHNKAEFTVSTDWRQLDRELIHRFLSSCYWAKGIPRETVDRSIDNSLCFGLYHKGQQVGFARVISDFATYAYIGDVFVIEAFRGRGLGKVLMRSILEHPALQGLRRWSLVTKDAHGLYAQFGFQPVKSPERHMEIFDREVYSLSEATDKKRARNSR